MALSPSFQLNPSGGRGGKERKGRRPRLDPSRNASVRRVMRFAPDKSRFAPLAGLAGWLLGKWARIGRFARSAAVHRLGASRRDRSPSRSSSFVRGRRATTVFEIFTGFVALSATTIDFAK